MASDVNHMSILPFYHLNDNSFNKLIYEQTYGTLKFDEDRLESLFFNPIDQPKSNDVFSSYLDPDLNAFQHSASNYMVEDELNTKLDDNNNSFSLLHLNARSLLGNLDKLKILLSNIKKPFSVIGITETWLNDQTHDLVDISGYKFVSNHRTTKPGGGVGLYLQNSLEYKLCSKCNYTNPDLIESIFVEICIPNGKNIIVGTVYRPPNQNVAAFLEKFNEIISIISKDNKPCYVMGDFNLDLLHYNHHALTQEFVDNLFSQMFFPLITKPTRLTSHSATLLDNIFTNNPTRKILNSILLNDISDHLPVFAYIYNGPLLYNRFKKTMKRNFSKSNLSKFQSFLAQTNCSNNLSKQDPNEAYNTLYTLYGIH
jgi:hypothetical protein